MKTLSEEQQKQIKHKQMSEMILVYDIAEKLNCKSSEISAAKSGKPISDDVYDAIIKWLG